MSHSDPTIGELLRHGRRLLDDAGHDAAADAEHLLCHALGCGRARLFASPDERPAPRARARFDELVARRASGVPLAHLLGSQPFRALSLAVTPDTLIPRADTETLVDAALACADADGAPEVLDLGTGTGAVALALASERPRWRVTATDLSAEALAVAADNARRLDLAVTLLQGNWFDALPTGALFDLIVSNPPYVAEGDPHLQDPGLAAEPPLALVAGPEGMDALRHIAVHAPARLRPGGHLWLEHGWRQGAAVRALLAGLGYHDVRTLRDAGDRERVTGGVRPTQPPQQSGAGDAPR